MSDITLTTPGLLFSAISLLLLAYTNRFLALASLIRHLKEEYLKNPDKLIAGQIENLSKRVVLIKNMQLWGVASLFLCVLCMFLIFADKQLLGKWVFGVGLVFLLISLGISIREIQISVKALNLHLKSMENKE
ncbi:MAG: DUF2721 domain-containing protein [Flavobacteriaceae bacterium]|jgi:hypothetical protein|nr:DUF2721 domain-containing protein [Flavobacteriaceae bacterium]